jgi:hypothetical protein
MSIYVYVTRKLDPLETAGVDISAREWAELIANDPDLSIADPPDRVPTNNTIYAVWHAYPGGYPAWFGLCAGSIEVKGIDEAILNKLRNFAKKLGARIVSEMGEEFL